VPLQAALLGNCPGAQYLIDTWGGSPPIDTRGGRPHGVAPKVQLHSPRLTSLSSCCSTHCCLRGAAALPRKQASPHAPGVWKQQGLAGGY
jgi:hypothetical protein